MQPSAQASASSNQKSVCVSGQFVMFGLDYQPPVQLDLFAPADQQQVNFFCLAEEELAN